MNPLEVLLATPLANYALEQLRARFLFSVTTNHDPVVGARVAAQMTFETEIGAAVVKLAAPSPSVRVEVIATRRRYLDVDVDMRANSFLVEPALEALNTVLVPDPYINLLRRHLGNDYPRYRVCGVAALLSLAAASS